MLIKFINENVINEANKAANWAYKEDVYDFIDRDFCRTLKSKGYLCDLDKKANVIKIGMPKNTKLFEVSINEEQAADIPNLSDFSENGGDLGAADELKKYLDTLIGDVWKEKSQEFYIDLSDIKLTEAILNEGPIGSFIKKVGQKIADTAKDAVKGVAKKFDDSKREAKKDFKQIFKAIEKVIKENPPKFSDNIKDVVYDVTAGKNEVKISATLKTPLTLIEIYLGESESERGLFVSKIVQNKYIVPADASTSIALSGNNPALIEKVLAKVAEKFGFKLEEPKFSTSDSRNASKTIDALNKTSVGKKYLDVLYNEDPELVKVLLSLDEDANDDIAAKYIKALQMSKTNTAKLNIIKYFFENEFIANGIKIDEKDETYKNILNYFMFLKTDSATLNELKTKLAKTIKTHDWKSLVELMEVKINVKTASDKYSASVTRAKINPNRPFAFKVIVDKKYYSPDDDLVIVDDSGKEPADVKIEVITKGKLYKVHFNSGISENTNLNVSLKVEEIKVEDEENKETTTIEKEQPKEVEKETEKKPEENNSYEKYYKKITDKHPDLKDRLKPDSNLFKDMVDIIKELDN